MGRSNTANGGSSYYDLGFQVVSADANQYTMRAVIWLTSLNVVDSTNDLSVGGNYSRSGALAVNGVYNGTAVWSQDISFGRSSSAYGISVSASWSGVNYWGTTLSASEGYTIPAYTPTASPPGPPTIAFTNIQQTSLKVWSVAAGPENGATTQKIEYVLMHHPDGARVGVGEGGYDGVTFTGLLPGNTYLAQARAFNAAGWGAYGGPVYQDTAPGVPSPGSVVAQEITSTSMRIASSGGGNPNGSTIDKVEYRLVRTSDQSLVADLIGDYTGVVFTGLSPATNYTAWHRLHNAVGWGGYSQGINPSTLPGLPGAPVITSVSAVTPTSAQVSWSPPVDTGGQTITAYDVQYSLDPTFATGSVTQATGTLTGLTPGGTYSVRVRAKNASGPGPWSNVATFTTQTGMKVYNGTAWLDAPVYAYNGTAWVACEVRIYNGTAWVPTG